MYNPWGSYELGGGVILPLPPQPHRSSKKSIGFLPKIYGVALVKIEFFFVKRETVKCNFLSSWIVIHYPLCTPSYASSHFWCLCLMALYFASLAFKDNLLAQNHNTQLINLPINVSEQLIQVRIGHIQLCIISKRYNISVTWHHWHIWDIIMVQQYILAVPRF